MRKLILIALGTFLLNSSCIAQLYNDSVVVGDTALLEILSFTPTGNCAGPLVSESISNPSFFFGTSPTEVYFAPVKVGLDTAIATITLQCYRFGEMSYYIGVFGYGVSDSFPKIRPLFCLIDMTTDSLGKIWTNHSIPTFDNPTPDTITFSEF